MGTENCRVQADAAAGAVREVRMGNEGERAARLPLPALCAENRVYKRRLQCVKSEQGSREQGGVDSSPAERAAGIRQEKAGQKWPDGEARPPKKRILTRACRNNPFTAVLKAFITVYKLAAGKLPVWGFLRYRGNFGAVTKARGKQNEKDAADEHRCAGRGH